MKKTYKLTRRRWLASAMGLIVTAISSPLIAETKIRRIPVQYIATLALGGASSGTGAESWGLWRVDPVLLAFGCDFINSCKKLEILHLLAGVLILMIGGLMKTA